MQCIHFILLLFSHSRLADIRFVHVIRAVCFFYYCLFLPFILLGKKIYWSVFRDTADKKEQAEKAVLYVAQKKGNLEKYGVVDLAAELKKFEEEVEDSEKKDERMVNETANDRTLDVAINQLRAKKTTRGGSSKLNGGAGTELRGMQQKQAAVPLSGRERNTKEPVVNINLIVLDERQWEPKDRPRTNGVHSEKRQRNAEVKRGKHKRKRPSHEKRRKSKDERKHKTSTVSSSSDSLGKSHSNASADTEYSGPGSSAHHSEGFQSHDSHEEHKGDEIDAPSSGNWNESSTHESEGHTSSGSDGGSWSEGDSNEEESMSGEHDSHGDSSDEEHSESEHTPSGPSDSEHTPSGSQSNAHGESELDQMEWDSGDDSFET